jgi:four helix bundle protein
MRRAGVSIPSNIAEGKGRITDRDRIHFYSQARGSLLEVETQIRIAAELGYVSQPDAGLLIKTTEEIGRSLNSLIRAIGPKAAFPSA